MKPYLYPFFFFQKEQLLKPTISISATISLRVLRPQEAGTLYHLVDRNREHLREWLPWVDATRSPADSRQFLEMSHGAFQKGTGINYGIRVKGSLAGLIGFHGFDRLHRVTSLGYWLGKEFCGNGTMCIAVAHCIDAAFKEENMNRLYIRCAVENARSSRIPKKLGLTHEGTQRQAEYLYDHFVDLDIYSVLAEEWDSSILGSL